MIFISIKKGELSAVIYAAICIFTIIIFIMLSMRKTRYSMAFALLFSAIALLMTVSILSYIYFSNYKYVPEVEFYIFRYISRLKIAYYEIKTLSITGVLLLLSALSMFGSLKSFRTRNLKISVIVLSFAAFALLNSNPFCEELFIRQHSDNAIYANGASLIYRFIKAYNVAIIPAYFIYALKSIADEYRASTLMLLKKQYAVMILCLSVFGIIFILFYISSPVYHLMDTLYIYEFDTENLARNIMFKLCLYFGYTVFTVACCFLLFKYKVFDTYMLFKRKTRKNANVKLYDLHHIFHTIKNYAMVIIALQKNATIEVKQNRELKSLDKIRTTAFDLIDQCSMFLDTYSSIDFNMKKVNIIDCVNSVLATLQLQDIKTPLSIETENIYIYAYENVIKEVCTNIFQNAEDAIKTKKEPNGEILIRIISEADIVCLSVRDNGCGISRKNLKNIFKPFFSTKRNFEHWGIGLAYVVNAMKLHAGFLNVKSKENEYTEMQLSFYIPKK